MKILAIALVSLVLGGCSTASGSGLAAMRTEIVWTGPKSPKVAATRLAEAIRGNTVLRNDGDHYWVIRNSIYGAMVRYDFYPTENGGSRVERESGFNLAGGADDKLVACLN